jgi:hypothetical protein
VYFGESIFNPNRIFTRKVEDWSVKDVHAFDYFHIKLVFDPVMDQWKVKYIIISIGIIYIYIYIIC